MLKKGIKYRYNNVGVGKQIETLKNKFFKYLQYSKTSKSLTSIKSYAKNNKSLEKIC